MVELNEKLIAQDWGPLSGFELYTVMMLVYFSQCQLDVCLIEVGIGGLWDCTNVLEADMALITTIGFDHQDNKVSLTHTTTCLILDKAVSQPVDLGCCILT